jgi:hypothetical protein
VLERDVGGRRNVNGRPGRRAEATLPGDVVGVVVGLEDVTNLETVFRRQREVVVDLPLRVDHGAFAAVGDDVGGTAEVLVQHLTEEHLWRDDMR